MFVNINKPKGPTSFDVVAKVRKVTGVKKVGHAGTLDPLASGVLVVAVGREYTRQISTVVEKEKEYLATVTLGVTSTTDDEEGEKRISNVEFLIPNEKTLNDSLNTFKGKIEQIPPIYSAVKVKGKEAYKYARRGQEVKMKSREVEIKNIEILSYDFPTLVLRVITGKGVYIRSLVRDIGEKLGTGAYMSDLVRERVGEFKIEDSIKVSDLEEHFRSLKNSRVV